MIEDNIAPDYYTVTDGGNWIALPERLKKDWSNKDLPAGARNDGHKFRVELDHPYYEMSRSNIVVESNGLMFHSLCYGNWKSCPYLRWDAINGWG